MQFEVLPVIDAMLGIYKMPLDVNRFKAYVELLTGNLKDDMEVPVGYFNPMARQHVIEKLLEFKHNYVEEIIAQTLTDLNKEITSLNFGKFKVVLNLADDLKGAWTNRFTTDYDSKFKISALTKRGFCNPLFWVTDAINEEKVKQTTLQYCHRTIFHLSNTAPESLAAHIRQEKYVARQVPVDMHIERKELDALTAYYKLYQGSKSYPVIFNFLYGDSAAAQLGYTPLGLNYEVAGYRYAAVKG